MIVNSSNEWDKLKTIVIGNANYARFPIHDPVFSTQKETTLWKETELPQGDISSDLELTTNERFSKLEHYLLTYLDVEVFSPIKIEFGKVLNNNFWSTDGMYNYCPRDLLLVIGNRVIECPMTYRSRWFEFQAYDDIRRAAIKDGAVWFAAPKPALADEDFEVVDGHLKLTEDYPIFDAANVCRLNDDLLYLVSETGNYRGGEWLQQMLPDKIVHIIDNLYSYAHIDSTVCPLNEGLVLLNGNRVNEDNYPKIFKDWERVYIQEDEIVAQDFMDYPYASKWIALNMLVIEPGLYMLEKGQPTLKARLEKYGEVIEMPWEMARTLGGGLHCCTLDLERTK